MSDVNVNTQPAEIRSVEGTKPTPSTNMADMFPQERWATDQAAADRADPWRDTTKVLVRDSKTGELVQRARTAGADGGIKPGKPVGQPGVETETPDEGDEGQPRIKVGEVEFTAKELTDAIALKAELDLKKATLPPSADGYELKMPEGFKLPPGVDFKFASPDDPLKGPAIRAAQQWAHKNGFTQQQFSEAMSLYASANVAEQGAINAAAQRERDTLGANGPVRVDAVSRWLTVRYPGAARTMINTLVTAKQLEVWEDVIGRFTSQGSGSFNGSNRQPDVASVDDAAWNKMTYTEKKDYAERATTARAASSRR